MIGMCVTIGSVVRSTLNGKYIFKTKTEDLILARDLKQEWIKYLEKKGYQIIEEKGYHDY